VTVSIRRFLRDESGATAIEYGLIAALVCLATVGAMMSFADSTIAMYQYVVDAMTAAATP
jgi:pilus assembly protein Flp/PilA